MNRPQSNDVPPPTALATIDEPHTWMEGLHSEQEQQLRREVRRFAWETLEPERVAMGDAPDCRRLLIEIGARRLIGPMLATTVGGRGLSMTASAIVVEELCRTFPGAAVLASLSGVFVGKPIDRFGSDELRDALLPELISGQRVAALALTEPDAGSDVTRITTRAVRDQSGWRLDGVKHLVSGALESELLLVYAVTDPEARPSHRFTAFVVATRTPGVTVSPMPLGLGLRNVSLGMVRFQQAWIADDAVLGQVGLGMAVMQSGLATERIDIAARALGAATRAYEEARRYAATRIQFDHPIRDFQAVSHRLAEMRVSLDAGRLLLLRATRCYDALAASGVEDPTDACLEEVAIAKLHCAERGHQICDHAVQILAAMGVLQGSVVESMLRDSRIFRIGGGTDEIQRHIIQREEYARLEANSS